MDNKPKTWVKYSLLIITILVMGTWTVSTFGKTSPSKKENTPPKPVAGATQTKTAASDTSAKQEARQLVVYYFMTTYRCRSCIFIEGTTRKAMDEYFANEQNSGRMVFKMVNVDEPQNRHFIDEYGLYTKTVIVSDIKNGKQAEWKNLDQVWNLIGREDEFKAYIAKEVRAYLGS
ncbi:MAG: hypothetical protein A2293_04050 [Elusimicrobia bacterium RIFOXYB2_FULL_49_7]|nr:MAG: hypothetical protein A2293_04050 [Elusimicrobia bacterium RIFOXYB2_FULL_49_7]